MPSTTKNSNYHKRRNLIFLACLGFLLLILVAIIVWLVLKNSHKSEEVITTTVAPSTASTPGYSTVISRQLWGAVEPTGPYLAIPEPFLVVIKHTGGPVCTDFVTCCTRLKEIQKTHMDELHMTDISYNFLIGGDGRVYSGRGWGVANGDVRNDTVDVAFIGNFSENAPSGSMMNALDRFILYASDEELDYPTHVVISHNQTEPTDSPGSLLFSKVVDEVSHYSSEVCYEVTEDGGFVVDYDCPKMGR